MAAKPCKNVGKQRETQGSVNPEGKLGKQMEKLGNRMEKLGKRMEKLVRRRLQNLAKTLEKQRKTKKNRWFTQSAKRVAQ